MRQLGKLQRNAVFRTVEAGGLDPHDFELSEETRGIALTHKPTGAHLRVHDPRGVAMLEDVAVMLTRRRSHPVGAPVVQATLPDGPVRRGRLASWDNVPDAVETWISELAEELATPDFWSTLGSMPRMADAFSQGSDDNSPFTIQEQEAIEERIAAIKREARDSLQLSREQLGHAEAKLDYLVDASKRVGRVDWRNLVAGTILTMATEAVLPAEATHRVFSLLVGAVSHLVGHPLPQLGP
jgi:hypothetical protein